MEARRSVTVITSFAFVGLLLLLTSPVASIFMSHPGDSQCPEEWYRFMNLCWTKVPAGLTLTDHVAGVYCQRLGARLYRADVNSVALCFKGSVRALGDIVPTFTRMFRKRLMGNNGM